MGSEGRARLEKRALMLHRRLLGSEYRASKDVDAGLSLPVDKKHPIFAVVRATQRDLLHVEAEVRAQRPAYTA